MSSRIQLIIDTDVALGVHHEGRPRDIDDGFAIAEALNSPRLDLRLITTVFGNAPEDEVFQVANEITALKGANVPVLRGASVPMSKDETTNAAVEGMADLLRYEPCAIAAIGPLTNMGLLARLHPTAFANITHLIVVAGRSEGARFSIGDKGPVQDFNFESDVLAAEVMLRAAAPATRIVLAGFELTRQVCVTEQDLETIARRRTDVARYFHERSVAWCRYWTSTFPADNGFHPWDSAAIAWLKNPDYFATESRSWRIRQRPRGAPWLECDAHYTGSRIEYCTGFSPGGASAFVQDVVDSVY